MSGTCVFFTTFLTKSQNLSPFLLFLISFCVLGSLAQGMSEQQVIELIAREHKAGSTESQIVTKLLNRGVNIDQIRRLRKQYDKQIKMSGKSSAVNSAVNTTVTRLRTNNSGTASQEMNTAKLGTDGTIMADASADIGSVESEVQATSAVSEGTGKSVFGRDIFNRRLLTFEPNMNIATPQNYVLGPGDQIVVDIYGASQRTEELIVSPDGLVTAQ